ncbi:MAG: FHA domain-containing protein [Candidatus Aminicenantes bacterium]|nr:MAG: FHA domain-containing protein [Candidatus Aminicenantes bacterium]
MVIFRKKSETDDSKRIVQLTIIQGNNDTDDNPGKVFNLHTGNNLIGRDSFCEVVLNSGTVSRRHANLKVSYNKKKFTVIDLGSANGIIVNPSTVLKKAKMLIKSGDEIQVGEILLKLLAIDQDKTHQTEAIDIKDLLKQIKDKNQN